MTWAIVAVTAVAVGTSIYQGEESRKAGSKSRRDQSQAQRQSLLSSAGQETLAAQAEAKANKKKPDVNALLFSERAEAQTGVGSTILAGKGGGKSLLGRKSSLMGGI